MPVRDDYCRCDHHRRVHSEDGRCSVCGCMEFEPKWEPPRIAGIRYNGDGFRKSSS